MDESAHAVCSPINSTTVEANYDQNETNKLDVVENIQYNYDESDGQVIHEYSDSDESFREIEEEQDSLSCQLSAWVSGEKVTISAADK